MMEGAWDDFMPLGEALRWGARTLEDAGAAGRDGAARQAAILLAHCLETTVGDMYVAACAVDRQSMDRYREAIGRRRAHEPLQYITGEQEFMSLGFLVDRRVLIPRPETEVLVEIAVGHLGRARSGPGAGADGGAVCGGCAGGPRFADVGTGSGAVAVSIVRFTGCRGYALDVSEEAIEVAMLNARRHAAGDSIMFLRGDFLEPLHGRGLERRLDCIVSNPPYVSPEEYESLQPEIRGYEPREALVCDDIAAMYERLASQAAGFLREGGLLAVEIGYGQAGIVSSALGGMGCFEAIESVRDLAGIERVIRCRRSV